jgi:hypothetical protein
MSWQQKIDAAAADWRDLSRPLREQLSALAASNRAEEEHLADARAERDCLERQLADCENTISRRTAELEAIRLDPENQDALIFGLAPRLIHLAVFTLALVTFAFFDVASRRFASDDMVLPVSRSPLHLILEAAVATAVAWGLGRMIHVFLGLMKRRGWPILTVAALSVLALIAYLLGWSVEAVAQNVLSVPAMISMFILSAPTDPPRVSPAQALGLLGNIVLIVLGTAVWGLDQKTAYRQVTDLLRRCCPDSQLADALRLQGELRKKRDAALMTVSRLQSRLDLAQARIRRGFRDRANDLAERLYQDLVAIVHTSGSSKTVAEAHTEMARLRESWRQECDSA